jgi:hypothetical protein
MPPSDLDPSRFLVGRPEKACFQGLSQGFRPVRIRFTLSEEFAVEPPGGRYALPGGRIRERIARGG